MRKICILGSAESTRDLAPFGDPAFEIWGLAWRYKDHPRMDRCFEIHVEEMWDRYAGDLYRAWLKEPKTFDGKNSPVTVYLRPDEAARYKKCKAYPLQSAIDMMGGEYFSSSFAYMLALAILEGVDEIAIYGVDLTSDEEYAYQRPNAEYLLGIARAKGIKLTIPPQSALLKSPYFYGRMPPPEEDPLVAFIEKKRASYQQQISDKKSEIYTLAGAENELETVLHALRNKSRGALGGWRNG